LNAVDVFNPVFPDSSNYIFGVANNIRTWDQAVSPAYLCLF
jgi:hypothetical protein